MAKPKTTIPAPPGAPDWWIGKKSGKVRQDLSNALLPYLAPEDQAKLRSQLAMTNPKTYKSYTNTQSGLGVPTTISSAARTSFLSAQRAQLAAQSLTAMAKGYGKKKLGAGYDFLKDALGLLNKYGGSGTAMNRSNYSSFLAEANALLEGASKKEGLSPYIGVASMFLNPNFSAGSLMPSSKSQGGSIIYGDPNATLY